MERVETKGKRFVMPRSKSFVETEGNKWVKNWKSLLYVNEKTMSSLTNTLKTMTRHVSPSFTLTPFAFDKNLGYRVANSAHL